MALRYGPLLGIVSVVDADARRRAAFEQMLGHTLEEALDRYAEVQRFVLDRADEARRLSPLVEQEHPLKQDEAELPWC
jgi:hypothetical protein